MKTQKGITLIALIITIVVLLILATVAITAMTQYNIIENANSAAHKYGEEGRKENTVLDDYNTIIDQYLSGGTIGGSGSTGNGGTTEITAEKIKQEDYSKLAEGTKVKYDSNLDGTLEDWFVLYNTGSKFEIVSGEAMGNVSYGYSDPLFLKKYNYDGGLTAVDSYNNIITTINNYCKELVKAENDKTKVRSLGSSTDVAGDFISAKFDILLNGKDRLKAGDNLYENDYRQLESLAIKNIGKSYLLASREVKEVMREYMGKNELMYDFCLRRIENNGNLTSVALIDSVKKVGDSYGILCWPDCDAVRPVVANPTDIYYAK